MQATEFYSGDYEQPVRQADGNSSYGAYEEPAAWSRGRDSAIYDMGSASVGTGGLYASANSGQGAPFHANAAFNGHYDVGNVRSSHYDVGTNNMPAYDMGGAGEPLYAVASHQNSLTQPPTWPAVNAAAAGLYDIGDIGSDYLTVQAEPEVEPYAEDDAVYSMASPASRPFHAISTRGGSSQEPVYDVGTVNNSSYMPFDDEPIYDEGNVDFVI